MLVDEARYGMDIAFIVMLFLTSLTGHGAAGSCARRGDGPGLALPLGVVFSLFVTMPMASSFTASTVFVRAGALCDGAEGDGAYLTSSLRAKRSIHPVPCSTLIALLRSQ